MVDTCPKVPAIFSGLPDDVVNDYTCNMGACMDGLPPIEFTIEPNQQVKVAELDINTGGGDCYAALPAGLYLIKVELLVAGDDNPNICHATVPEDTNGAVSLTITSP